MSQSLGNVMVRAQYLDMFKERLPFLNQILFQNLQAPETTYDRVFNVQSSDKPYEEKTGLTGFGLFGKKTEAGRVDFDTRIQTYDKRLSHETWGKGYQYSFEMMDDDMDGIIASTAPELARAAINTIETDAFADFNNSFSTVTTPDGVALFGTHILAGGGTFSNLISGDLAQATIESALNKFADMRDERNLLIRGQADILLIPTELQWTTYELLRSQLRSDTANNAANALNQVGLQVVVSPYLTGDDDYFVMSEPSQHELVYYWKRQPYTDSSLDFDTQNMKTAMFFRMCHGAFDWRNMVGGQGA